VSKLLVVHHTTSPATQELLEAALSGLGIPELSALQVETRAALSATSADVLSSDGCLLLTPANIGYMSGAMKHFFDQIYYPCLQETRGRPYALVVHGNNDTTGAIRGVESICKGLDWRPAGPALRILGAPTSADQAGVADLAGLLAAAMLGW